jgi:hypothetical protein
MDNKLVKGKCVDGDFVFTRVILKGTCEETMGEEELVNPVNLRNALFKPSLEEFESDLDVLNITSKGS